MQDIQRSLGKLEGNMEAIKADVKEIKMEVKLLSQFKWRVAGGAAVLSVVVASIGSIISHWLRG